MAPPEPSGPTTATPEDSKAAGTQENEPKIYFMNIVEALKKEIKISLKEVKVKTSKKLEEINNSLKESQEKKTNR